MWCLFLLPNCNKNSLYVQLLISHPDKEVILDQLKQVVGEIEPYYNCAKNHGETDPSEFGCFNHEPYDECETFKLKYKENINKVITNNSGFANCCPCGSDQFVLKKLENFEEILSFKSELVSNIV